MPQSYRGAKSKNMTILSQKEVKDRYYQIRHLPHLIEYLDEVETAQLLNLVGQVIGEYEKQYPDCCKDLSIYQLNCDLLKKLDHRLGVHFRNKSKTATVADLPAPPKITPSHPDYAMYHYINEIHTGMEPNLISMDRKTVIEYGKNHYNINGLYFYNAYLVIKGTPNIVNYLNRMKKLKLENKQRSLFEIARKFNNAKFIEWWNLSILHKG
jgi:hypothetical protein